ncbi:hypothetical protein J2R98_001973 [Alkalibacillus filiformis]|uniref:Uncharacterized protein n=1 Tax=Alkalibacillus filiformis TaxID=200990 RepID=A0ABU0DUK5_9BACI|nr:DUF3221 domain-containing protein [Alkalibacillus filiformis]MDQ0352139.1 hypothetical protein [Alkalibacillus filiformis]
MDEKLNQLHETYKNETNFTEKERYAIMSKVKHEASNKSGGPLFPLKIAIPLATTLLIAFIIFASNDGGPLFQPTTGSPGEEQDEQEPITDEEPSIEGYVVEIDNDRILVTDSEKNENDQNPAVWYSSVDEDVELGQKIKAWHTEQNDSYPAQAVPDELLIVEEESYEGADMTEYEAIARAINSNSDTLNVPIVSRVHFDSGEGMWNINLRDVHDRQLVRVTVDDSGGGVGSSTMVEEEDEQISEPNIEDIITEFENAYDRLVETDDEQRLVNFNTVEDIRNDFSSIMSDEIIDYYLETYVQEEDDGLYIIPTGMEVFIELDRDYEVNEVSETEYHVIQEVDYEFTDHIELTYIIEYQDENWIVQDVLHDPIDE